MIVVLVLIAATVLPFFWEYVFERTLRDTEKPKVSQLVFVAFTPLVLSFFTLLMGTNWASDIVISCILLFIFLISTLTWGYTLYNRESAPAWFWLLLAFLTFCLYIGLLFLILIGSSGSWNINF